jgi:hypothetical protein
VTNGEASLIYPPYAPQYGLNDTLGTPVSSLRLESMRDGIEDVEVATLYRKRFGQKALRRLLGNEFGKVQVVRGKEFTWPKIKFAGLGTRMENNRREMIAALER